MDVYDDSLLFYQYIKYNGYNPGYNEKTLELLNPVNKSVSRYLKKDNHSQFLLSREVKYEDLDNYDIDGANGYIDKNSGIVIPNINHKNINNIDLDLFKYLIILHDWNRNHLEQINQIIYLDRKLKKYIGFIFNNGDTNKNEKIGLYKNILYYINIINSYEHTIVHDTINNDKELYLIKTK